MNADSLHGFASVGEVTKNGKVVCTFPKRSVYLGNLLVISGAAYIMQTNTLVYELVYLSPRTRSSQPLHNLYDDKGLLLLVRIASKGLHAIACDLLPVAVFGKRWGFLPKKGVWPEESKKTKDENTLPRRKV